MTYKWKSAKSEIPHWTPFHKVRFASLFDAAFKVSKASFTEPIIGNISIRSDRATIP